MLITCTAIINNSCDLVLLLGILSLLILARVFDLSFLVPIARLVPCYRGCFDEPVSTHSTVESLADMMR